MKLWAVGRVQKARAICLDTNTFVDVRCVRMTWNWGAQARAMYTTFCCLGGKGLYFFAWLLPLLRNHEEPLSD